MVTQDCLAISRLLAGSELFSSLSTDALNELALHAEVRTIPEKEVIFVKGASGSELFAILNGRVKISSFSEDGKEIIFTILESGNFFGETALLDGQPRSATCTAIEDCQMVVIERDGFISYLEKHPSLAIHLLSLLSLRLRRKDEQIDSSVEDRNILSSFQAQLLLAGEKPIGMLAVTNSFPGAFSGEDLRVFSIISRHSSIAINNTLLHKKITELSITDGLTGLYVYRYFNDALEKEILRSARYRQPFGLIMIDLDSFKKINDSYGHPQGDEVLKEVSQIFRKICREVDIVARYGGEEFAIILPETDMEGAFVLADRIRMVIKNYAFGAKENVINLTASIGVASYPDIAISKTDIIKHVDRALYKAKAEGRNKTCRAIKEITNEVQ